MLDHDHGVAEIAQALEGLEQTRVVALVQADGGLVEHVKHAGEAAADLRSQPNALALAAGQCAGRAGEREIVEADIDQELQPFADFLEHPHANFILLGVKVLGQLGEPGAGALHAQLGHLGDMLGRDLDAKRFRLEPGAVAGRAGHVGEIFQQVLARPLAFGLLEAALEIGDHALERLLGGVAAQAVVIDEFDVVLARAVQDRVLRFLRQVLPFDVEREAEMFGQRVERLDVIGRA